MSKKKKHAKKNRVILVIFIIMFFYSGGKISKWYLDNNKADKINNNIYSEVITPTTKLYENEIKYFNLQVDFSKLISINEDVVGYIEVPNTDIAYPILQSDNNEYYLKRDIYKNYNSCGAIFMSYYCNSEFNSQNTVLFGHNMKSGKMFAFLNNILNKKYDYDIEINIYTPTNNIKYKPFSIYVSEPILDPIKSSFSNEEEFINNSIAKSEIDFNIDPSSEGKVLTLSTCDNSGKNRTILHAIKIIEQPNN